LNITSDLCIQAGKFTHSNVERSLTFAGDLPNSLHLLRILVSGGKLLFIYFHHLIPQSPANYLQFPLSGGKVETRLYLLKNGCLPSSMT
jgi:hypothetical protein